MSTSAPSLESLKAATTALFAAANAGWANVLPFCTADAIFRHSRLGVMSIQALAKQGDIIVRSCTEPLTLRAEHLIAEGLCVAAEYSSHAVLVNGAVYDQVYHFKLFFNDAGLVTAVHEYADTLNAAKVWGALLTKETVAAAEAARASE